MSIKHLVIKLLNNEFQKNEIITNMMKREDETRESNEKMKQEDETRK